MRTMYPRTPISIQGGRVLAYIWDGHEYQKSTVTGNRIPIYRLGRPTPGMWRNGRLLRLPHRSDYVTAAPKR